MAPAEGQEIQMYVCVCNGVTDSDIQREVDAGCASVSDLTMRTGAGANCGSCVQLAQTLIDSMRMKAARRELDVPVLTPQPRQFALGGR